MKRSLAPHWILQTNLSSLSSKLFINCFGENNVDDLFSRKVSVYQLVVYLAGVGFGFRIKEIKPLFQATNLLPETFMKPFDTVAVPLKFLLSIRWFSYKCVSQIASNIPENINLFTVMNATSRLKCLVWFWVSQSGIFGRQNRRQFL